MGRGSEHGGTEIRERRFGKNKKVVRRQRMRKRQGTSGEAGRGKKSARAAERKRGGENEVREGEGKRDMQMWSARLRRGRKSQRNGVGVGNIRGQRDREPKRE